MTKSTDAREQRDVKGPAPLPDLSAETLLEHSHYAVVTLDGEWRYRTVNERAAELLRRQPDELIGHSMWELYPGLLGSEFEPWLREAAATRRPARFELRYAPRGVCYEVEALPAVDGMAIIFRDVTERSLAADLVVESEALHRALFDQSPVGVFRYDCSLVITHTNESFARMMRTPRDVVVGLDMTTLRDQRVLPAIRAALDGETASYDGPYNSTLSGAALWVAIRCSPMRDGRGPVTGGIAVVVDLTEQRRAEAERAVSEERYRQLFEQSPAANYITTPEGRLVACNARFLEVFGFASQGEAMRTPMERLYASPADREAFVERMRRERRLALFEIEMRRVDGTPVTVLQNVSAQFDGAGGLIELHGSMIDVTERRRLEAQLLQAQKMEAVGQLAGGVAHDFNNMLTAIKVNAELLLSDLEADSALRHDVEEIVRAADRSAALTRQLLAFSRRQVLQPRTLLLNEVVTSAESMLRRLLTADVSLETSLEPRLRAVRADPAQMEQVLLNLVVNARDALPQGGPVRIETANVSVGEDAAAEQGVAPGAYVVLRVRDAGVGMDEATRARIFEPFFTTKEAGKGTGLGLAMVYGIVRQSGGFVTVHSAPGHGSSFEVHLPATAAEASPAHAPAAAAAPPAGGHETVLLVEDEETVRATVRRVLERRGYTVLEARNGAEALELSAWRAGSVDVVVTDVLMPELSGEQLSARLRARYPNIKVLFMSGYTGGSTPGDGADGVAFIEKPFHAEALARALRDLLDGRRAEGRREAGA